MRSLNNLKILTTATLTALSLTTIQNSVNAADVVITTSKPLGNGSVEITVTFGGITQQVITTIAETDTEAQKREKIVAALVAKGYDVESSTQSLTIKNLRPGTTVKFSAESTAEGSDSLTAEVPMGQPINIFEGINEGAFNFDGTFNPVDPLGNNSTFLVGYSSSLGQVSLNLTSDQFSDLSAQTVANTFYNQLVSNADSIGVNLSLDGSRILLNYDPGVYGIGLQFGTTSGSGTVGGSITLASIPEPTSTLGILALGTLGAGATLKRKLKPSKLTEKETLKVG